MLDEQLVGTYGHFVSCLDVEHEILDHVHFVLSIDDVKTWTGRDTDVSGEQAGRFRGRC